MKYFVNLREEESGPYPGRVARFSLHGREIWLEQEDYAGHVLISPDKRKELIEFLSQEGVDTNG